MKNRFFYYQLLDEREEQLINKAGIESFHVFIGLILLSYLVAILAPALFNPDILLVTLLLGILFFFNRARQLGVTYYSRFHFTIISFYNYRVFAGNSRYYVSLDVGELSIQYRNLSAQSSER